MANLYIVNFTSIPLFVTGTRGTDISGTKVGQRIEATPTLVGTFNASGMDSWDWMNLGTTPGENRFQIYVERHHSTSYACFGYYDPNSTQADSNPTPFPKGVSLATHLDNGDFLYILLAKP